MWFGIQHMRNVSPVAAWQAGEGQCVEPYRTLGPGCIEFLAKRFQVTQRGSAHQPFTSPPQQGGATKVNQGAVTQCAALTLRLFSRQVAQSLIKSRSGHK